MTTSHRFSRRALIARLGGCAALLPFLTPRRAQAAPGRRRFVMLQPTNGVLGSAWWPNGGETAFALNRTMAPLEPHKQDLIILRGLELSVMRAGKPDGVGAWGGHESLPFLLTGSPGALSQYDGSVKIAVGNAMSLDWYLGTKLGSAIPSLVLGAGYNDSKGHWGPVSFRGPAVGAFPATPAMNQAQIDPRKAFERLFAAGTPAMGGGLQPADIERQRKRQRSVLDLVRADLSDVLASVGGDDRARIEAHLQGVREIEKELDALAPEATGTCEKPTLPADLNPTDRLRIDKILPVQSRLIVAALRCGLTQNAVLQMCTANNNGIAFPFLGDGFLQKRGGDGAGDGSPYWTHHHIAHNAGNGEVAAQKNDVDRWFVQVFADLLKMLKDSPGDAGGSLFDSTVVLYANNMENGAAHSITNMPWVLAGSCGGAFKTGRYLDLGPTPHNKLLASIANAVLEGKQAPLDGFGDRRWTGEITRLRG